MRTLERLVTLLTLIICGLFSFQSEIKAQGQTQSANLKAIKDKRKVYVFGQSGGTQNKIEQVLKTASNLEVVTKAEDAEFFISESVDVKTSTETPPNLRHTLNRLETPDMPQNNPQQKAIRDSQEKARTDSSNPMKLRNITIRKTTIQVYFLKADGAKVIVWSKDVSRKISSAPQSTRPINNTTDTAPEVFQYYKQKDDAGELTKSFVKKLKAVN